MQKYKLLKDLPLAKAGTIVSLNRESRKKTYWQASIMWETGAIAYIPQSDIAEWLEDERKPKSVWDLKDGDECYILSSDDRIFKAEGWYNDVIKNYINIWLVFLTEEEAEKELEKRKAIAKIKEYCWKNGIETEYEFGANHVVFYLKKWCVVFIGDYKNWNPLGYFSHENAEKILENFEEELKIILE